MTQYPSDAVLVRECLIGDSDRYRELVRRHQQRLYKTALCLVGDHHTAEEMCLEAFQRAYSRLAGLNGKERYGSWLISILVNLCRDHLRGRAQLREVPLDGVPAAALAAGDGREDPRQAAWGRELEGYVRRAVQRLPWKLQLAWILFAVMDMPLAEIAAVQDCSLGTVKSRLFNCRKRLQRDISKYLG